MGIAKKEGGLYYVHGVAVDAEGKAIKGAPVREPNTVVTEQPANPVNVMVAELAKALRATPAAVARQPDGK